MGNYKPNYFIMGVDKLGYDSYDHGMTRVVGYYSELETAITAVKENCCDIWESCYDYVIVEEVFPGLYPDAPRRWFFGYDKATGKYNPIDEPVAYLFYANLTIG
jgi:hypothetical protein